jgi:hypothetical protein
MINYLKDLQDPTHKLNKLHEQKDIKINDCL